MTTIQPTELTCEIRTNLIRDDASPFDFKFEVTCIDEASEENEYERRVVGILTGFTFFPGSLTKAGDFNGLYNMCDSRADYLLDGYTLLRNRRASIARAATGCASSTLKGLRGVVICERLVVNPALRGSGLGLRLLREVSHMFSASKGLLMMKASPDGQSANAGSGRSFTDYLLGDKQLGLGEIVSPSWPGWLAGLCRLDRDEEVEEASVILSVNGPITEIEELVLSDRPSSDYVT